MTRSGRRGYPKKAHDSHLSSDEFANEDPRPKQETKEVDDEWLSLMAGRRRIKIEPVTMLGTGLIDPFWTYPSEYNDPKLHDLIDHCSYPQQR